MSTKIIKQLQKTDKIDNIHCLLQLKQLLAEKPQSRAEKCTSQCSQNVHVRHQTSTQKLLHIFTRISASHMTSADNFAPSVQQ
jgi:hypothetical protein